MAVLRRWPAMWRLLGGAGLVVALLVNPAAQGNGPQPDVPVSALIASATKYVQDYQTRLMYLIATEDYVQRRLVGMGRVTDIRIMRGEMFLTFLPADNQWVAVHDVAEINGQKLAGREDLQTLLRAGSVTSVAKQVKDRNAQFNLGTIQRNFNEPTFALQVVEPENVARFQFQRGKVADDSIGTTLTALTFREVRAPTLVMGRPGHAIFCSGELTIETETGRIRRTRIGFRDGTLDGELTTEYARDAVLDLFLPALFTERWHSPSETIEGEAKYSRYHRFEVSVRIR